MFGKMKDRSLLKEATIGAALLYALFLASHFRHPYLFEKIALEATCPATPNDNNCFVYSRLGLIYDNAALDVTAPQPQQGIPPAGHWLEPPKIAANPHQAADPKFNAVPGAAPQRSLFNETPDKWSLLHGRPLSSADCPSDSPIYHDGQCFSKPRSVATTHEAPR